MTMFKVCSERAKSRLGRGDGGGMEQGTMAMRMRQLFAQFKVKCQRKLLKGAQQLSTLQDLFYWRHHPPLPLPPIRELNEPLCPSLRPHPACSWLFARFDMQNARFIWHFSYFFLVLFAPFPTFCPFSFFFMTLATRLVSGSYTPLEHANQFAATHTHTHTNFSSCFLLFAFWKKRTLSSKAATSTVYGLRSTVHGIFCGRC